MGIFNLVWGGVIRQNQEPPKRVLSRKPFDRLHSGYKRIMSGTWIYLREILFHLSIIIISLSALGFLGVLQNIMDGTVVDVSMIARDFIIAYSDVVITIRCILMISRSLLPTLLLIGSVMDRILKGKLPPPTVFIEKNCRRNIYDRMLFRNNHIP
jgi:hypothetical protein